MNLMLLIILQLMLLTRHTRSESCGVYGELREVKEGRKKFPQVCDHTSAGLKWYLVCKSGWDIEDAHVWCKQLGYFEAESEGKGFRKPGSQHTPKIVNLICHPENSRIVDCPKNKYYVNCDLVSDVKCRRCVGDTQCSGAGFCDSVSGKCKCAGDNTCGPGRKCENERCVKSCASTCPENSNCSTIGGCVVVVNTLPTTTTSTPSEPPTTTLVTELPETPPPTRGSNTTAKILEATSSHSTVIEPTRLAATRGPTEHFRMTFLHMLILSVCVVAMFGCVVLTCTAVLAVCYLNSRRQRRKKLSMKQNEYEEMAPLPSCSFHEYNNCSVSTPPYSPIHYDSVNEDAISYSTVRSLCESFVADDRVPHHSTCDQSTAGNGLSTDSTDGQMPYYSTVGEEVLVQEQARYYSTAGDETTTETPYYSTISDDAATNSAGGQAPYYSTVEDTVPADVEGPASYYSTLGDATYASIDGEFGDRVYANINGNVPIEPYLIT